MISGERLRVQGNAREAVGRAIREGRLTRQPCLICGNEKVDAHHEDYSRQLDVVWLCRLHHRWLHRYHDGDLAEMRAELAA